MTIPKGCINRTNQREGVTFVKLNEGTELNASLSSLYLLILAYHERYCRCTLTLCLCTALKHHSFHVFEVPYGLRGLVAKVGTVLDQEIVDPLLLHDKGIVHAFWPVMYGSVLVGKGSIRYRVEDVLMPYSIDDGGW
eukprot:TRINITY_DN19461_c0_g1_i2.p1 TRINITY_DN19461_c0_g1~~TRINITY_DN19461_c0_g1_i2.p1  ORF type:complete len:137 (-),score=1.49 TRINITY_DN19461_c0_g1_i2:240-650(-)